jgi:hypothetical protein
MSDYEIATHYDPYGDGIQLQSSGGSLVSARIHRGTLETIGIR